MSPLQSQQDRVRQEVQVFVRHDEGRVLHHIRLFPRGVPEQDTKPTARLPETTLFHENIKTVADRG